MIIRSIRILAPTILAAALALQIGGCRGFPVIRAQGGAAAATAGVPTEQQKQMLAEAGAATEAGNYDTALAIFQDILAENPNIVPAYLGIGGIFMIKERFADAEPVFERAARLEPRNFDAQLGHGLALHMLRRFGEAVRAFHRALSIDPDDVKANLAIATAYLQLTKPESALVFAQRAAELEPANGAVRSNLGAIYEMMGRYEEAIAEYTAAMELMPPSAPLMLNLVNALSKSRRYNEVVNTAENLVKLEENPDAYERMGYAHFRLGEYDASIEAYRSAVRLAPEHWQAWNGIGVNSLNRWLLSKKRETDAAREAREAFRRSLRANPDQPKVVTLLSNYQL